MKKKRRIENRIIAVILCMAILFSQVNIADAADLNPSGTPTSQVALSDETNMSNGEASTESTVSDEINGTTESESKISEETSENSQNNESESSGGSVKAESTDNIDAYYKDGKICIYNYEQLKQIGSDAYIYTGDKDGKIGSGDVVKSEGTELKYGADAQYILMNDIQMNSDQMWSVPDSFIGTITGTEIEENETPTLYDKETDTIYIYNPYQLMVLAQEESETEPVMSLDYDAPQFGMGQMIYPNGEDKDYLTYSKDHNYVISKNFSSDKPELVADQLSIDPDTTNTEGRDFKGQVVKTIGDKTYILIGNEDQLRAIGSGKTVYGAVYQAVYKGVSWKIDTDGKGNSIMLYGGDADLKKDQNGNKDYQIGKVDNAASGLTNGRCGVDQKTGKIDPELDYDKATEQTYSSNANYIIFRDIDLGSSNWKPLTFQGTLIGAKSTEQGGLWKDGVINTIDKPVISNVTVNQSDKINVGEQMGVGFFSTISNEVSEKDIGLSKGLVKVSNIQFDNLKVHTTTNETYYPDTLISTLTSTLGKLLGVVLSGLTFILTFGQVKIDLKKTLGDVLDARKKDPTALATGAIAGRVEGQVELSNLEVNNATVKNVNNNTGGFVGYIVGKTQYDGLSNALGELVDLLTNILNVIPGLGLGDLITILLGNAIPLEKLIPTGYINAKIMNCTVNGLSISTASDKEYAGGFIGMQKGAIVENCSVTGGTNTIKGKSFVGGFVGLARDDVIEGTLSGALDIETKLPKMNTESLILNCSLNNAVVSVSGESYIGGFAGGLANASTVNCNVKSDNALTITASGNYAGGFAGIASLGWAADLGKDDTKDNLLGGVKILDIDLPLGQMINVLNVFVPVIKQSSVEGYQSGLRVQSNDTSENEACGYAGGYVGKLIGGQIWGEKDARCKVTKLRRVDGRSYVGGFVGSSRPGSVATVDPLAGEGLFLSKLLKKLLDTPADLIKVLNATVATIRYADVESWDNWGIIINGAHSNGEANTSYAKAAGGFAGMLEGTVLGEKDKEEAGISAQNIRSVVAGEYAGGCFGIADVAGVANISVGSQTSLLDKLLQLGRTDVLDTFRSYVYYGTVSGSKDAGLSVSANEAKKSGQNNEVTYSGTAGGFGGSLLNGSVKNSKVTNLSNVRGLNSVGGFVGYSGKSGVVKADKIDVLGDNKGQLLGGALGVLDIFGSHIDDCTVTGTDDGYTVQSTGGDEQIAGGFIGYANLARMSNCTAGDANNQKIGLKQVASGGTAGGFAGRTSFAYLADLKVDSGAVNVIFSVVNELIKALYLDKLQDSDLLKINLGIIKVDALYDGKLLHVNLLGLDISVGLSKKSNDKQQSTDLAIITIGDSSISLPCNENGLLNDDDAKSNISVNLIKANRTKITDSNVYGVSYGYDVYAGGAGNDKDGSAKAAGQSGGFVGFNDEGLLKNNNMYYCDVVRGTKDLVGPFSGKSKLDSVYEANTQEKVEGENNNYRIYRKLDVALDQIKKGSDKLNLRYEKDTSSGWDIYTLGHMNSIKSYETLQNAKLTDNTSSTTAELKAYESPAKAVLMADTKTTLNTGESDTPEPSESQDPCDELIKLTINKVWKDLNNLDEKRPANITVTISRTWKDANGIEQTETWDHIIKGSINKSTWQEVIKGLPAYMTDENKIIHYYTYSVTETEIKGYTTTIETSKDGFTFTIINRHFALLPDTGGEGIMMFIIAGGLLLAFLLYTGRKRKQTM